MAKVEYKVISTWKGRAYFEQQINAAAAEGFEAATEMSVIFDPNDTEQSLFYSILMNRRAQKVIDDGNAPLVPGEPLEDDRHDPNGEYWEEVWDKEIDRARNAGHKGNPKYALDDLWSGYTITNRGYAEILKAINDEWERDNGR